MNACASRRADFGPDRAAPPDASCGAGSNVAERWRFAVHGPVVEVDNFLPALGPHVRRLLGTFAVPGWPDGFAPVHGTVRPYEQAEVLRHLSPGARPLPRGDGLADVFEEGERFWVVDERWGMAEINFLKGQWRSWVLPRPQFDAQRCAEMAVLWPLAQLLRPRGVHLLPAAAAARDGWSFLMICPFGVGPELGALVRSGYKLIGQRWTAVREEDGRVALLHMPGPVEPVAGRERVTCRLTGDAGEEPIRLDGADHCPADFSTGDLSPMGAWQNHAFCDAVLVADAVRRPRGSLKELDPASAAAALRSAWPIVELHPSRRHSALQGRLAQVCRCAEVQLSRDPGELLPLLLSLRKGIRPNAAAA